MQILRTDRAAMLLYILAQRCDAWQKLSSQYGTGVQKYGLPAYIHAFLLISDCSLAWLRFWWFWKEFIMHLAVLQDCLASCFSRARGVIKYSLPPNSSD